MAFAVTAHPHPVAARLWIAPPSPPVRGPIDKEPAAAAVAARAKARPLHAKRDQWRNEEVAERGPALVGARERAVRLESVAHSAEQEISTARVSLCVAACESSYRVADQAQPSELGRGWRAGWRREFMTRSEELACCLPVGEMIVRVVRAHAAPRQPEVPFRAVRAACDDDQRINTDARHFLVRVAITRKAVVPTCPWPSVAVTV